MEPDKQSENILKSAPLLTELADAQLLQGWKAGDEQSAEILVDRYVLRLIALVGKRLNRRFQGQIDPTDIVQSAMGSFFLAARHSRIQVSHSTSLWQLLATFARRKMARAIEKQTATKRGGGTRRLSIEDIELADFSPTAAEETAWTDEFIGLLETELHPNERDLIPLLLAGSTQQEIAKSLGINERTVRRRITNLRQVLSTKVSLDKPSQSADADEFESTVLPRIDYQTFVLGRLVGTGGFGKVYRATMQADGSIVAVKFLRKSFWRSNEACQSFLREIKTASQIEHSSVVKYFGWGQSPQGGPYIVCQWIAGETLQEIKVVQPERFLQILKQVIDTIGVVHATGLVHGDLTPANIFVSKGDQVTITDFGFSQPMQHLGSNAEQPLLGGTIGFAAPEQLAPAFGKISTRTDIYAIGGLAYWYLTGRPPHDASSLAEAITDTLAEASVSIKRANETNSIRLSLQNLASTALQKAPNKRPQTANDLTILLHATPKI